MFSTDLTLDDQRWIGLLTGISSEREYEGCLLQESAC